MTAQQVVAWAASQIGQHETPWGSNRVPYWTDVLPSYQGGQWCGAFTYDALMHGGADLSWTTVRRFVYTPWGLADARSAGIFYTGTPRPGDVVWFNLDGRPGPEHVGVVAAAGDGVHIHTIEGNVSDQVKTLIRSAPQIIGYARITYLTTPQQSTPGSPAPAYPLPSGSYFGPRLPLSNARSVSGYYSHRADLARWQSRMLQRGWDIRPDGLYGPQTAGVARGFQREKHLGVDSLIGPVTWRAAWESPIT